LNYNYTEGYMKVLSYKCEPKKNNEPKRNIFQKAQEFFQNNEKNNIQNQNIIKLPILGN
jgi:hypothetical protein